MSEIAALRKLIDKECEAMKLALNGFRVTASHEIISNHYNNLGAIQDKLALVVGEKEATKITVGRYIEILG